MSAVFVTGTGTDIGKTFVTAGLVRHLRRHARAVAALKPVASGFDPLVPQASDAAVLLEALGRPVTLDEIDRVSPWRFRAPLSPDMAAEREGRAVDVPALVAFSRQQIAQSDHLLLIEGVGGVMVPLDGQTTVLDWMAALDIPVLLVAGSYLGAISHALTALAVLAQRRLRLAAVVVNESPKSSVPLGDTVAALARFARSTPVIGLPRLAEAGAERAFAGIAQAIDACAELAAGASH